MAAPAAGLSGLAAAADADAAPSNAAPSVRPFDANGVAEVALAFNKKYHALALIKLTFRPPSHRPSVFVSLSVSVCLSSHLTASLLIPPPGDTLVVILSIFHERKTH